MVGKEVWQPQRQVEAAVARRFPHVSKADRERITARILDHVAQTLDNGGHPAGITLLSNGQAEINFISVEEIGQQVLDEGRVG
jgi:hypothetical protein